MSSVASSGPQGQLALWLKRVANVGFVIAAVYCVYLIALLVLAAKRNAGFEGQQFGTFAIERYIASTSTVQPMELAVSGERRAVVL